MTCQSTRCIDKGAVFCKKCVVQEGTAFDSMFRCLKCNERDQKYKKKLQRAMKNPKRRQSATGNEMKQLRQHFRVSQAVMASYLGISHRQYQAWERDFSGMQPSSRVQIYLLCQKHAPEFADHWYEDGFERFLIPPVCNYSRTILSFMYIKTEYDEEDIILAVDEWTPLHKRALRNLIKRGLVWKAADGKLTRNDKLTQDWWKIYNCVEDGELC